MVALGATVAALCGVTYEGQRVDASVTAGSSIIRAADFNPYGVNNDRGMVGQSGEGPNATNDAHVKMQQAGIGWMRYWMSWQNIQWHGNPDPATWNWSNTDRDIDAAISNGMNVYVTILSAPSWLYQNQATTYHFLNCMNPANAWCGPQAVPFDSGHNVNSNAFRHFVREAVKRYGNRVKFWSFWNEGNNPMFWPEQAQSPCDRLGQLIKKVMRPGREAALEVNPSVQIVGPEDDTGVLLRYALEAERDGKPACGIAPGRLFDVIAFHAYQNQVGQFASIDTIKSVLNDFDRREVWLTEVPTDGYIDGALEQFKRRGWISKIFAYVMRNPEQPAPGFPSCSGFGLVDFYRQPCYGYWQMYNFTRANPPSMRFAGLIKGAGQEEFLQLTNPHASATNVNIRFSNSAGVSSVMTFPMAANSRATPSSPNLPFDNQHQAASIWTDDPSLPVWAEHVNYWNNRDAGRAAQAASERSDVWYFAEGTAGGGWVEDINVYNPSPTYSVLATWTYINVNGGPVATSRVIPPLGVYRLTTTDVPGVEVGHSTVVSAVWYGGNPSNDGAPITAERTISWGNNIEGHGGKGVAFASPRWYFAEGAHASGGWSTYIAVVNPTGRPTTAEVRYLKPGGFSVWYPHPVGAQRRISFAADETGEFGIEVRTTGDVPVAVERAMYLGAGWTVGTVGEGASVPSQRWLFPEGTTYGVYFSTFFLLANPSDVTAYINVTFRLETGAPVVKTFTLPAGQRLTIDAYAYPELAANSFSTEIVVTGGSGGVPPGIIAERAMYWPIGSGWAAGDVALGMP